MEKCMYCGKPLKQDVVFAWGGLLFCSRVCIINHLKKQGIPLSSVLSKVDTESEAIARNDIDG